MFLFVSWLRNSHSLSMYVTRGMEGDHPKCFKMRTGGEYVLIVSLFMLLSYGVLFYL